MDFFIISFPRSGSSLVRLILNTHPEICVPPESSFLTYLSEKYNGFITTSGVRELAADIANARKFEHWNMSEQDVLTCMEESPKTATYAELITSVYRGYCSKKSLLGDKNNINWRHVDQIKALYPKARLLLNIRHPLGVYSSLKELHSLQDQHYAPSVPETISDFLFDYMNMLNVFEKCFRVFSDNTRMQSYEDFVRDPLLELRGISKFLGVSQQFNTAHYFTEETEPKDLMPWKRLTRKPVTTSRINAWREVLNSKEIATLQSAGQQYEQLIEKARQK